MVSFFERADPERHFLVDVLRKLSNDEFSESIRKEVLNVDRHELSPQFKKGKLSRVCTLNLVYIEQSALEAISTT